MKEGNCESVTVNTENLMISSAEFNVTSTFHDELPTCLHTQDTYIKQKDLSSYTVTKKELTNQGK